MLAKSKLLLLLLLGSIYSYGQISITLRKSFIDSFKNQLTIQANYAIYKAHKHANPPSKDGDLHFAGHDRRIGMPIVAEIMNAKYEHAALQIIRDNDGNGTAPANKVSLSGAWRIWCEHPGNQSDFRQGAGIQTITSTNPDHAFEIHPVTKIENISLLRSLKNIDGYQYKDAAQAFTAYSNARCKITQTSKRITIQTNGVGYNYVDFWIKLNEDDKLMVSDGLFADCTVLSSDFVPSADGEESNEDEFIITHKMRMAFVKDSEVYNKVKNLGKGAYLHVTGIPRINLDLVSWRAAHASQKPAVLSWNLPVEMIIVGERD